MEVNLFERTFEYIENPTEEDFVRFVNLIIPRDFSNVPCIEKAPEVSYPFLKAFYNWAKRTGTFLTNRSIWYKEGKFNANVVSYMPVGSIAEQEFIQNFNRIYGHPRLKVRVVGAGIQRLRCGEAKPSKFMGVDDQLIAGFK